MGVLCTQYVPGACCFEFNLTRKGSVVGTRLKTFNGLLQTDGYKGYDALRKRQGIIGFGCLSHARRKFSEVIKIKADPHGIAASMIARLKPLYELEARLRDTPNLHHRTRKRLRQKLLVLFLKALANGYALLRQMYYLKASWERL